MQDNSMEHHGTVVGKILIAVSTICTYVSIRGVVENSQPYATFLASLISIVAGCFAIRYYIKKSK